MLTIFDLAPGDGVEILANPYLGAHGTVETVGSDPAELSIDGTVITEPFEWARVRIDDGVRIYTVTYDLADLEKLPPRTTPLHMRPADPPVPRPEWSPGDKVLIRRADGSTTHRDARATVESVAGRNVAVRADGYCNCTVTCVFGGVHPDNHDPRARAIPALTLSDIDLVPNPEEKPRLPFRRLVLTIDLTDEQIDHFGPEPERDTNVLIDMIAECHGQIEARWEL